VASSLDTLVNTIPVILVGGMVMKMTEKIMSQSSQPRERVPRKRKVNRTYTRKSSGMSFGNFSNIGY